jgi:hypothetical protein
MRLILLLCVIGVLWDSQAFPQVYTYESKLTTTHYNDPDQIKTLIQALQPGAVTCKPDKDFQAKGCRSHCVSVGEYMDAMFKRVQVDLDMPLPKSRVNIRLVEDQVELNETYLRAIGTDSHPGMSISRNRQSTEAPLAFYWKKTSTIYLQPARLSVEILAHEMAHAVTGSYFIVHPPHSVGEMISDYAAGRISTGNFLPCISS